jgi:endonuclease YncB( thermonuclease family)
MRDTTLKALAILMMVVAARGAQGGGTIVEGRAQVIDGATIVVLGTVVRLAAIAAPQRDEPGRYESTRALSLLVAGDGARVRCELSAPRWHGGSTGWCRTGGERGADVQARMVAGGWAATCRDGRYAALEASAMAERRGLWALGYRRPAICG